MSFRSQQSYVSRTNSQNNFETTYSVFYVNNGYMLGVNASKDATIDELQNKITELFIPKKEQMIFLSNGNMPSTGISLVEEGVGTERKPLFLYRRLKVDEPTPSEEMEGLETLIKKYDEVITMLNGQQIFNLQKYSQKSLDTARLAVKVSQKVIADHEHLSEAWNSMIKFLDDSMEKLKKRYIKFENKLKKMDDARKDGHIIFNDFDNVFETLKKITVPSALLSSSEKEMDKEVSLYDWIRSKDPVYHLTDLVTHVQEELAKLDEKPVRNVKGVLDEADNGLKKKDVREVSNLNDRLNILRQRLQQLVANERSISNILHQVLNNPDSPETLENVKNKIMDMADTAKTIVRSKTELLNVIRQRAKKNFLMLYDILFKADGDMIIFEEKINYLGDQLKLLNQIRETPILYATAVVEVIRRQALRKEFNSWLSIHNEKCSNFYEEENKLRVQFNRKFDKHFLRQLFCGMSDKMPQFSSPAQQFDTRIPKIDYTYLHQLRNDLSEMASLLNVQLPDVFNKLLVVDKNSPISIETSQAQIRPNESFFTHEKTTNMETINRNFPSTNYLSGFDSESPKSYNMHRFGQGYASQTSLNFSESIIGTPCGLKSMTFDIGDKDEENTERTSFYTKSDPISIPSRSSVPNQMSATSSQFNTPDNEFGSPDKMRYQQIFTSQKSFSPRWNSGKCLLARLPEISNNELDNDKEKEVAINTLKNFKSLISSLFEEINETKGLFKENEDIIYNLNSAIIATFKEIQNEMERKLNEHKIIIDNLDKEKEELSKIIEHEKYLRREKESELEDAHNTIKKQNEELLTVIKAKDDLHADILKLETEKRKLESSIDTSGNDYIDLELKTIQEILGRQLSDEEVERIKSEVEQRRRVLSPTPSEQSEKGTNKSQTDYENALRKKMQLIIQGIENKKDIEIAKMREEFQAEMFAEKKEYEELMQIRISELENKLAMYQNINEERVKTPPFVGSPPNDRPGPSNEFFNKGMQESCMVVNNLSTGIKNDFEPHLEEDEEVVIAGEEEIKEINTVGTQTRIRMKEMSMMISLQDIHEGCSVLVMWDNSHNSYMVFSTSRTLHFVRESCMKRFYSDTQSANRRNWMFAVVTHIDYCQIKKETNRYNMPLGTRFYRVEVKPLAIEQSSTAPSRRS